mgnify:CR=1 FL=1
MKRVESIFMVIILICLCVLALASVFIWHNILTSILFTAGIFIWLWAIEGEQNN